MSPAHEIRNALVPLSMHDDSDVREACARVVELLRAVEVDLAAVEGLRQALSDARSNLVALGAI